MVRHVALLGHLYVAAGGLSWLAALSLTALALGAASLEGSLATAGGLLARVATVAFGTLAAVAAGWGTLSIATGVGLARRQPWARPLALALAASSLPVVPFGTALTAYTCWVLLRDEGRRLFAGPEMG